MHVRQLSPALTNRMFMSRFVAFLKQFESDFSQLKWFIMATVDDSR